MMDPNLILALLIAYCLGSIPFARIIAKWVKGTDLHKVGSRNIGARNLTKNVGLGWGILGLLLDAAKGAAAMWVAVALGISFPAYLLAGLAAVGGHNWPVWLRFRGGKGLATAFGTFVWLAWPEALISFALWLVFMQITRNVLIASIAGFSTMFFLLTLRGQPLEISFYVFIVVGLVVLAALPDMWQTMRTPGGVSDYFSNPEGAYEKEARKKKRSSR